IFLVPGLPKDVTCYLFGLSPMPFWVFAVVSTLGRFPGTWVLSAQGARTASGDYLQVILLTAIVVAVALPLYYYRHRLVEWLRGKRVRSADRSGYRHKEKHQRRPISRVRWPRAVSRPERRAFLYAVGSAT